MSNPNPQSDPENEYPEDIKTVEESSEEEELPSYTDEEDKQAIATDSEVENYQLTGLY
mgnify:CR=1 FL=1